MDCRSMVVEVAEHDAIQEQSYRPVDSGSLEDLAPGRMVTGLDRSQAGCKSLETGEVVGSSLRPAVSRYDLAGRPLDRSLHLMMVGYWASVPRGSRSPSSSASMSES